MKFVSVIMSVYGEEETWLRKAIESILSQTHTKFEFIIISDNPKNYRLWEILEKYERLDNRIILLKNEQNIGLAASLNKGLDISKGDYIVRMDADDISVPKRIEVLVHFMENNLEIGVCSSWMKSFGASFWQNRIIKYPTKHDELEISSLYVTPIAHAPCIIRRSVIEQFTPFYNIKCCRTQDYELWSRLMHNDVKFATIPEVLYFVRGSNGVGPVAIPFEIIHNQISRKNIMLVLKEQSLPLHDMISISDIKALSNVLKNKSLINKQIRQLSIVLFLFYMSIKWNVFNRIAHAVLSGHLIKFLYHIPIKLTIRIFIPSNMYPYSVNKITNDETMSIY